MSDGSNLGITAGRALGTIIGGDDQPAEEEMQTKEQVRERVMSSPFPVEGSETIFERYGEDGYSVATDCIAKAFLLVEEKFPGTLEEKVYYTKDNCEIESLWGMAASAESAVWNKAKELWPEMDDQLGGASGFMVGFAYNTALWLTEREVVQNPAILTIEVPDE